MIYQVGDHVIWHEERAPVQGTVLVTYENAVVVQWDDGKTYNYPSTEFDYIILDEDEVPL